MAVGLVKLFSSDLLPRTVIDRLLVFSGLISSWPSVSRYVLPPPRPGTITVFSASVDALTAAIASRSDVSPSFGSLTSNGVDTMKVVGTARSSRASTLSEVDLRIGRTGRERRLNRERNERAIGHSSRCAV